MKNLIVIDLSNLGSAYAIINRFVDLGSVEVFEISPIGTGSLLILNVEDQISSQILFNNIKNEFNTEVKSISLITDVESEVIKTYLSQAQAKIKKNILIIESSEVSRIFSIAQIAATRTSVGLVDFRVVRTNPCNANLVLTSDNISDFMFFKDYGAKMTIINDVQQSVKDFFEVLKN